jgi:hypothetical protein
MGVDPMATVSVLDMIIWPGLSDSKSPPPPALNTAQSNFLRGELDAGKASGQGVFSTLAKALPQARAFQPPPPSIVSPEVQAARKAAIEDARKKKARGATILTSGRGVSGQLGNISRPQARGASLLGG